MRKFKLNDYCEFPMNLDMYPYTKEGLASLEGEVASEEKVKRPASYYHYELKGILVHSGDADAGHYYSFIKVTRYHKLKSNRNTGKKCKFALD
jgi:ubiquitin C-terminal hydrolase